MEVVENEKEEENRIHGGLHGEHASDVGDEAGRDGADARRVHGEPDV